MQRLNRKNRKKHRPALGLLTLILAVLLAGCSGTATTSGTTGQNNPVPTTAASSVTNAAPTTVAAQSQATNAAPVSVGAIQATTAPAPATTAAQNNPAPTTTQAANNATPVPNTAAQPSLPPVGNSYPAGPAPTAAPQSGGGNQVQLRVPDQLKKGVFQQNRTMTLPSGFSISVYAQAQGKLRMMAFSPDNVLFATEQSGGNVVIIRDNNGVGERSVFAEGLNTPHGLTFHNINGQNYLYVAEMTRVVRFPYSPGQPKATNKEVIVNGLPGGGNHVTRTIVFGLDGKMYVSVGSSCNTCEEGDKRRAAIVQYNADGSGEKLYAEGLRNGVGLAVHPQTGEIWETENSRDNLGDNLPPEEINIINKEGAHYGWPYCIGNRTFDSNFGKRDQNFCNTTVPPALPMQAHSAPMGISFYTAQQFPQDYQGDAFVAFRGSWNRSEKTGYKVVRVHIENGRPTKYEDFLTGFLVGQNEWGRPIHPIVGPDGSLYLSDDTANAIYKITYNRG